MLSHHSHHWCAFLLSAGSIHMYKIMVIYITSELNENIFDFAQPSSEDLIYKMIIVQVNQTILLFALYHVREAKVPHLLCIPSQPSKYSLN